MANSESERRDAAAKWHASLLIGLVFLAAALTALFGFVFPGDVLLNFILVVVLIACMAGYRSYCSRLGLSDEETGDSLYYLGFLFTAAALAAGILVIGLKLQASGGAAGDKVIVSFLPSFAVALLTTIAGLCWRVVLSRGGGENDASTDLVTAYSELTDRLLNTAADIEAAYAELKDQLLNVAADLTDQTKLTTDQFQILLTILKQKAQEVEQEFTGFTDSMSAALSESGAADYAAALKESIETLNKAAEAMSESSRDADSRLESAVEALTAIARQLSADAAAQAQTMQDASSALDVVKQEAQETRKGVADLNDSMSEALSQYGAQGYAAALKESIETLNKAAEAMSESSRDADSRLESAVEALTAIARQLSADAAAQAQTMQDASSALDVVKQEAQETRKGVADLNDSMSEALSQYGAQDYADALKESAETLNKAAEAMSESSRDADSRLESAGEALTAAAGQLSADAAAQAQTMQDASSALDVVKKKAQEAGQAVVAFKSSVEALHKAAGELKFGKVEMVRSAEQLSESAEGLRKSSEALASSKSTASLLENAVNNLTAAVKQLDANSDTQKQTMEDTLKQALEPLISDKQPGAKSDSPSPRRFWPRRR